MMAKAARPSVSLLKPTVPMVRDQTAIDIFVTVTIFSLAGLVISLAALMLALPQVVD
jgi:hypothetical protein